MSIELSRLSGRGRLQFSRKKETHWSFSFIEVDILKSLMATFLPCVLSCSVLVAILLQDPSLEMTVNSQFEGRRYPQLSSIIESQVQ